MSGRPAATTILPFTSVIFFVSFTFVAQMIAIIYRDTYHKQISNHNCNKDEEKTMELTDVVQGGTLSRQGTMAVCGARQTLNGYVHVILRFGVSIAGRTCNSVRVITTNWCTNPRYRHTFEARLTFVNVPEVDQEGSCCVSPSLSPCKAPL
jgi:hypothetical protein